MRLDWRKVHHSFSTSQEWVNQPLWSKSLTISMLLECDSEGRCGHDAGRLIALYLTPGGKYRAPSEDAVRSFLDAKLQSKMLREVEKDGCKYYQFTNFKEYQRMAQDSRRAGTRERERERERERDTHTQRERRKSVGVSDKDGREEQDADAWSEFLALAKEQS